MAVQAKQVVYKAWTHGATVQLLRQLTDLKIGVTMSAHDKLVEMMENYIAENKKFSEKKVKAAAVRARAALQEIGKAVKERRKEIIEEKNNI